MAALQGSNLRAGLCLSALLLGFSAHSPVIGQERASAEAVSMDELISDTNGSLKNLFATDDKALRTSVEEGHH